jgi:cytochrome c oxidase cbb3-type subunit 4
MFKFIKQYAETMENANVYALISMFIFLIFFIVLLIFVKNMSKEKIKELSNIPLEDDDEQNNRTF